MVKARHALLSLRALFLFIFFSISLSPAQDEKTRFLSSSLQGERGRERVDFSSFFLVVEKKKTADDLATWDASRHAYEDASVHPQR